MGCGPCNLCCDLMGVEMKPLEEGKKPPFWPCKFMCSARGGERGCCFREVDGDADAWNRIMEKNRPKTKPKILEPA